VAETLREIGKTVKEHHETLFGNGRPGLKERMQDAERDIEDHQKFINDVRTDFKVVIRTAIGALLVMAIAAVCSMAYSAHTESTSTDELKQIVYETVRAMKTQP